MRDAVQHQRDRAGGVGLEREPRQVVHDLHLVHVLRRIGWIGRRGMVHDRLGFALPVARLLQPVLEVADAREILIETAAVARADIALQVLRLVGDGVEDAASGVEPVDLSLDLLGRALQEKLVEHVGRALFGRNGDAGAGPRKAADRAIDGERERREARESADALGDVLVERNGVAERAARRVRRGGQEADVRRMPAVDVGMRDAAEHGEVVAVLLQHLEVGRSRVVAAGAGREEQVGSQAEVVADAEHPARPGIRRARRGSRRARERRQHRVEERQRQRDAHALQKTPARDGLAGGDEGSTGFDVHVVRNVSVICSGTTRFERFPGPGCARRTGARWRAAECARVRRGRRSAPAHPSRKPPAAWRGCGRRTLRRSG